MLHKINIKYIHFLLLSGIFEIESNPHVLQKYNFTYKNSSLQAKVLFANEKGFEPEVIYQ